MATAKEMQNHIENHIEEHSTQESCLLKMLSKMKKAKEEVFSSVCDAVGNVKNLSSSEQLARDMHQIHNFKATKVVIKTNQTIFKF